MSAAVSVRVVHARKLAAVTRRVRLGTVASAWQTPLDVVWAFLRANPGLHTDGHNVFLYRHPERREEPMDVDFGVDVSHSFAASGEVHEIDTPAGEAAVATHVGPYDRLPETHAAIHAWAVENRRTFAGHSMEIYGDWSDDPSRLETTVVYFLA